MTTNLTQDMKKAVKDAKDGKMFGAKINKGKVKPKTIGYHN